MKTTIQKLIDDLEANLDYAVTRRGSCYYVTKNTSGSEPHVFRGKAALASWWEMLNFNCYN